MSLNTPALLDEKQAITHLTSFFSHSPVLLMKITGGLGDIEAIVKAIRKQAAQETCVEIAQAVKAERERIYHIIEIKANFSSLPKVNAFMIKEFIKALEAK